MGINNVSKFSGFFKLLLINLINIKYTKPYGTNLTKTLA